MNINLLFKPLDENDLKLLHQWFQEPTIHQQYARGQIWSLTDIENKYLPRLKGQENVPSFIIYLNNEPVGFIQYYLLSKHSYPEGIQEGNSLFKNHHANQIAGIDLFIASHEHRGQGLGAIVINQFISQFLTDFCLVVVNPNRNNTQAIRCYEKAGFEQSNYSEDPTYLIMIKNI